MLDVGHFRAKLINEIYLIRHKVQLNFEEVYSTFEYFSGPLTLKQKTKNVTERNNTVKT